MSRRKWNAFEAASETFFPWYHDGEAHLLSTLAGWDLLFSTNLFAALKRIIKINNLFRLQVVMYIYRIIEKGWKAWRPISSHITSVHLKVMAAKQLHLTNQRIDKYFATIFFPTFFKVMILKCPSFFNDPYCINRYIGLQLNNSNNIISTRGLCLWSLILADTMN